MRLLLLAVMLALVLAMPIKAQFDNLAGDAAATSCPYPGFDRNAYCPINPPQGYSKIEVKTASGLPPLSGRIGVGFNPATGTIKLPVVKLTYNDGSKIWTNPRNGARFQFPDQTGLNPRNHYEASVSTNVFRNVFHFLDTTYSFNPASPDTAASVGGIFNNREAVRSIYEKFFVDHATMTVSQDRRGVYELHIGGGLELDDFARRAVDFLPEAYDQASYLKFIEYWGTHYVTYAVLGGMADQQSVIKQLSYCAGYSLTDQVLVGESQTDLHNSKYGNIPDNQRNAEYTSLRSMSIMGIMGGNPELGGNWDARVESLPDSPVIITANYRPIAELIANPAKRDNMQRAVNEYLGWVLAEVQQQKAHVNAISGLPMYRYTPQLQCGLFQFITTNKNELGCFDSRTWRYRGVLGYCAPSQIEGTVPLHRYNCLAYSPAYRYCFTPNAACAISNHYFGQSIDGWPTSYCTQYEGVQCYIYTSPGPNRVPLYRYFSAANCAHYRHWIYETNPNLVRDTTYTNCPVAMHGIVGYLSTVPTL